MNKLDKLTPKLKTGKEPLILNNKATGIKLNTFWQWSTSDLLSNATRGKFAEFIIASAINIDLSKPRDEWAPYDLETKEGIKIEVKTSAYLQSWYQKKLSNISFSIKAAQYWDSNGNQGNKGRFSDIYVFCLLNCKDKTLVNPLDLSQWLFYILPTKEINNYKRSQTSITLKSINKITQPVKYNDVKKKIYELVNKSNSAS